MSAAVIVEPSIRCHMRDLVTLPETCTISARNTQMRFRRHAPDANQPTAMPRAKTPSDRPEAVSASTEKRSFTSVAAVLFRAPNSWAVLQKRVTTGESAKLTLRCRFAPWPGDSRQSLPISAPSKVSVQFAPSAVGSRHESHAKFECGSVIEYSLAHFRHRRNAA